jgi:hypothetical protein
VVLSADAYIALITPRPSLTDYLLSGPVWSDELVDQVNDRARDTGRDIEL